ncbi:MAG: metallopeptidase family protein [Proteobacteria bacterium]|nr:metallopeptidase family protein [Pseudomonadota bacterium]
MKLSEEEFDRIVKRSIRRIPKEIRQYLDNIIISVRQQPTRTMLREMGLPSDRLLLGLYHGVPLIERSAIMPPLFPDTILLFQKPIEEVCQTMKKLEEQIEVTVVHEIAHFFGITEERLKELGYG